MNIFRRIPTNASKICQIRSLSATEHCLETVKKYDYENFVCTLLLKTEARRCGIAVRAFNVEVARSQDQVTSPAIAQMKYTFWEDAVEKLYKKDNDKILNHPVVIELHRILRSTKLSKRHLLSLIRCRKDFVQKNKFATLEELEQYAEKSVSPIYYLLLEASGVTSVHADHAASHLGKAQGICQLLRSIPIAKTIRFISLPQDLLAAHRVSEENVIRAKDSTELREVVFKVATRSNQHLEKARSISDKLNGDAISILLPATIVDDYLQRLLTVDCDVFHPRLQKHRAWMPKVWWRNFRKTY